MMWTQNMVSVATVVYLGAVRGYEDVEASKAATIARLFDHLACREAISAANFSHWRQTTVPQWLAQEIMSSTGPNGRRMHIVRDQKVASATIFGNPINLVLGLPEAALSDTKMTGVKKIPSKHFVPPGDPRVGRASYLSPIQYENSDLVVTFVRTPWQHLLSGYVETEERTHRWRTQFAHVATWRIPCTRDSLKYTKFKTFLKDVEDGVGLSPEAFHTWPQALLINAVAPRSHSGKRFDLIGRLQDIEETFADIRQALGAERERALNFTAIPHSHDSNAGCAINSLPIGNHPFADPEATRRFCELYEVDYVCFDFPIPVACLDRDPDYAQPSKFI